MRPASSDFAGTILIAGASRGLGLAMAAEFLSRGWSVVGTVRGPGRTALHGLAERHGGRLEVKTLDVTQPEQVAALRERLSGRTLDVLFVNAGTTNADPDQTVAAAPEEEFVRVMLTNTLGPMRVVEGLQHVVAPDGLIGVMSSGQGSIAANEKGGREVYRASKAALNQCMRSYAARQGGGRSLLLMAPGWIRTDLGGQDAPYSLEESVPPIVDVILAQCGRPGLWYLDRDGRSVAW